MSDLPVPALRRILVPLDGSRLSEAILPTAVALACHYDSCVTLLHVLEKSPPATVHGERHLTDVAGGETYLASVATRLAAQGVTVETHVHAAREGDVARSIAQHAAEVSADLIALSTHGRGGLRGLLFGRIAQQTLQQGDRPVLLVTPLPDGGAPPFDPHRILVPLYGNPDHETAVPMAVSLACAFGAALHLALVVPTVDALSGARAVSGMLLPTTMRAILDLSQQEASDYLRRFNVPCEARGVTVHAEIVRGDPASAVVGLIQQRSIDLVVMATHGRAGLEAFLAKSVTSQVASRATRPLLLVRAGLTAT